MNEEQTKSKAEQLSSKIKQTWNRLSDSDVALATSKRAEFLAKVQSTYSIKAEEAEKRLAELEAACQCATAKPAEKAA